MAQLPVLVPYSYRVAPSIQPALITNYNNNDNGNNDDDDNDDDNNNNNDK